MKNWVEVMSESRFRKSAGSDSIIEMVWVPDEAKHDSSFKYSVLIHVQVNNQSPLEEMPWKVMISTFDYAKVKHETVVSREGLVDFSNAVEWACRFIVKHRGGEIEIEDEKKRQDWARSMVYSELHDLKDEGYNVIIN